MGGFGGSRGGSKLSGENRITLEEALTRAVMDSAGNWEGSILVQRLGFCSGEPQGTRVIGEELGLDHVLVGRICNEARLVVKERSDPPQLLHRTIALVVGSLPCSAESAEERLRTEGFTRVRFTPEALVNAATLYSLPCPFRVWSTGGRRRVVQPLEGRVTRKRFYTEHNQPGRSWRPFRDARDFARGLDIHSRREWEAWVRGEFPEKGERPADIPTSPLSVYGKKQFRSWGDFLGTENVAHSRRRFRPFRNARAFARRLGLRSLREWWMWSKGDLPEKGTRPADIPCEPHEIYRDQGWKNWMDFLGTEDRFRLRRAFRSFTEARIFARNLGLNSRAEWERWSGGDRPEKGSRPGDIPSRPDRRYRDRGWKGWGDFLGTVNRPKSRPYSQARAFARGLCLKSSREWMDWSRGSLPAKGTRPADIPSSPWAIYGDCGWNGWDDFLGRKKPPPKRKT
jgi:hypothetical protein